MLLTDAVETCAKFCRGFANKEHPEVSFQTSEVLSEAQALIVLFISWHPMVMKLSSGCLSLFLKPRTTTSSKSRMPKRSVLSV